MNNSWKHNHEREEGAPNYLLRPCFLTSPDKAGRSVKPAASSFIVGAISDRQTDSRGSSSIASKRCAIDASRIRQPFNYCCVRPQVASGVPAIERVKESSRSCFLHRPWCHSAWRCSVLGSRPRGYSRMPSAAAVRCFAQKLIPDTPRTGEPKNFPGGGII